MEKKNENMIEGYLFLFILIFSLELPTGLVLPIIKT